MKIIGENIFLKELSQEHVSDYLDMFSPRVQEILGVSSPFAELAYVQTQTKKQQMGDTLFFCIYEQKTGTLVGSIEIRSKAHRGQLCTWLHEDYWGTGYFQEAFKLASESYFKKYPHEDHFTARVDVSNKRSYNALRKLGCREIRVSLGPREQQYELEC